MTASDADRVNDYADAVDDASPRARVRAVIAMADREQATLLARIAELEAKVERLRKWRADDERHINIRDDRIIELKRALADERAKVARLKDACAALDHEAEGRGQIEGRLGTSIIRRLLAGETLGQIDTALAGDA